MSPHDSVRPIRWVDDHLELLDQRRLPEYETWVSCAGYEAVADAIRSMVVRGAPAIGIAGAYGLVLAAQAIEARDGRVSAAALESPLHLLRTARPTAVNLGWALDRMRRCLPPDGHWAAALLLEEAHAIAGEDLAANRRMGELGAACIDEAGAVLTHCNTGSLATAGYGTALGVIRRGFADGRVTRVYADETRPWLQGARLTAWELVRDGIPVTLLVDGAAPLLMQRGEVRWVIVGADRITANGDVVNKIGTYGLALSARAHGVRFMVVAPSSTVDMAMERGESVTIECRDPDEILSAGGRRVAPPGVEGWNPVFDVTPAGLVDVLVTERGVLRAPDAAGMAALFGNDRITDVH